MALISLVSALVLGAVIVRRIRFALYPFEAVAIGVVLGLFLWTWAAFLAVLVMPYDVALPVVITLTAVATVVLWSGGRTEWRPLEGGRRAWAVWGAATAVTTPLLTRLFWTHNLPRDAEGIWSAAATWADFGLHAAFVNHIAANSSLPSDLPIASGEKVTYPFLIDLLSGLYVHGGWSLHLALFLPGVLLVLAACQLIISVGLRMFGRISVGVGGLGLALTIGSAAGTWVAWHAWRKSGQGLFDFLGKLPADFSQDSDRNANVTNFVADALLPQRSILFGLGVGLVVLTFLIAARERKETKLLWPAAILIGLLPMAHPHSFMAGMAFLTVLTAEAAWRSRAVPGAFLRPFGLALLIALPQILWQQLANDGGTGGRFRFAWMWQHGHSLLGYWWVNFGLMGLAFIAIPIVMRRDQRIIWFIPMLIVFVVTQIYAFQPFEYDNLKLIYWVYLIAGYFVAYLAGALIRRHKAWIAAVVPLGLFVMLPGALAIGREFQLHDQFASPDDIALADWAAKNTPTDAVFLGTDRPNVPVASLAGRTVVLGYRGWLFNFSIPYTDREAAVRAALAGKFEDPAVRKTGAKYLIVGASEDPSWTVDQTALQQRAVLYQNNFWKVYQVQ